MVFSIFLSLLFNFITLNENITQTPEDSASFNIHTKAGELTESCYHDPCSDAIILNTEILKETKEKVIVAAELLGGSREWESNKISWNNFRHIVIAQCSLSEPSISILNRPVTYLPFYPDEGIPGMFISASELYLKLCHDYDGIIEDAIAKFNYHAVH